MYGTIRNFAASTQLLRKAAVIGVSASALLMFATSAQATNLVLNGSFEINGGPGQVGFNTTLANWSVTPGSNYEFLYAPGTADTGSAAVGQYGQNPLWGPGNGSANGLPATSPDGGYFAALDGDFQTSSLSQTITGLTVGDTYAVSFYWAASQQFGFDGPTVQAMNVCLGSSAESYVDAGTQPLSGGANNPANLNCPGSGASTANVGLASHDFSGWQFQTVDLTANSTSDVLSFLAYGNLQVPPFALLDGVSMTDVTPEPATLPLLFTGLMGGLGVLRSKKWFRR
jgi:hypothetical protein